MAIIALLSHLFQQVDTGGLERMRERRESSGIDAPHLVMPVLQLLLRHLGLMLDELSAQGLQVWQDERQRWRWEWTATGLQAERGFWSLGEAIVDAVVTRYPAVFSAE